MGQNVGHVFGGVFALETYLKYLTIPLNWFPKGELSYFLWCLEGPKRVVVDGVRGQNLPRGCLGITPARMYWQYDLVGR